jgi:hypothetical protein
MTSGLEGLYEYDGKTVRKSHRQTFLHLEVREESELANAKHWHDIKAVIKSSDYGILHIGLY